MAGSEYNPSPKVADDSMAGVAQTTIVYCVEGEQVPYRVIADINPHELTLAKFKFTTKRFNYRFFFLSFDQEFGSLKDELSDESAVCPSCRALVQAWLLPLDLSEDTSKLSPMTGTPKNLTGLSEANTGVSTNESSSDLSHIISGCSSNQSSEQHAKTTSKSKLQPKQLRVLGGFMTSSPTSWVRGDEQRCRSAEMYREHQHQEITREVLSDTCAELLARSHWVCEDVFDRGSVSLVHCSDVDNHRIGGQAQYIEHSSAHDIVGQTLQGSRSVKPGPGMCLFRTQAVSLGLHTELSKETENSQLLMNTESEANKFSNTFNLAFFEENTPRELDWELYVQKDQESELTRFQPDGDGVCPDINLIQVSDCDETNKSDVGSLPVYLSLRSDEFYPTNTQIKLTSKNAHMHSFHRKKNKQLTSDMQGKVTQVSKKKLQREHFPSDKEWLKLNITKDCLPSYSEACIQHPSIKHYVSEQESNQCQSSNNNGPCSFCENLCSVYESMGNLCSETQTAAKVSTTDIFSVSTLQRSSNNSEEGQEITNIWPALAPDCTGASIHERGCVELVERGEELHNMKEPLIGREQHFYTKEKEKGKKRDKTESSESCSVLQYQLYEQHTQASFIDADVSETFAAMKCQQGPKMKDRKWLGCVIPHAVIGKDLTQWLRRYRSDCPNSKAARVYAQKMLDQGLIRSFLSSEVKFKEQWYYTVLDSSYVKK